MVKIAISKIIHDALAARALKGVFLAAQPRPDGMCVVSVTDKVSERLDRIHPDPERALEILYIIGAGHV